MRALIIANGEPPSAALALGLARAADLIVAADGGADKALALGVIPQAVVGDFDSASSAARASLPPSAFHHVPNLDATDLQKSVEFVIAAGHLVLDVICAGGGRADHALGNLSVLTLFRGRAAITFHDDLFSTSLVEGSATVTGEPGTLISLVAIGRCTGVTTRGLRWDLTGYTLDFSPIGIHNELAEPSATIACASGDLLLFQGNWVEHHR